MTIDQYIDNINKRYKLGNATEHTFRGDLQQLIESLVPTIRATNEPKRQSCGAPDYILTKKDIPVGFIEAKDIGDKDLEGAKKTGNKEQFDRYKASLNNLIFTDYLDFHLYREGQFVTKVAIAELTEKGIKPLPENFERFENLIKDFCTHIGQTIKSSKKLAEMMAGKARLLSEVIEKALTSDETHNEDSTLKDQMNAFKQILIHDITPKGFADVYAQTIAYGMFAARSHDLSLATFSRQEAYELIPKSNPFLKKLFGYIAGLDVDDRIKWIVDDLVNIFLACNVEEILKNYNPFGKGKKSFAPTEDPIIHFYETFLSEYDPKLRKARGVWYTPAPVVSFIVRAVDDILKTEFDLPQGLADTSKTEITTPSYGHPSKGGEKRQVHKVQILDPATGTGTFLAEVIKLIHKKFEGQQGIWSNYVETHLLPRLNGFELLMASYAMAHLKLDLLLAETGYKPTDQFPSSGGVSAGRGGQRIRVYLTNSLEEYHQDTGTLFANWLSTEANEANHIKRDTPVMCVIGNPPYSGISSNNGEWISKLIDDYKYIDGIYFNERKHWLNDDYVKFIRYGQHFIEKNGSGVLAFINPHGFLDNPTFRGMRWNLLKTYDKIYTIDLHGNSKKKETAPDGSADVNVFDIQQGVSINIFIKTGKKKANELGKVFHFDLYGKREMKYDFLSENTLKSVSFEELKPESPFYFFVHKNNDGLKVYEGGFKIDELFPINVTGVVTARDSVVIDINQKVLLDRIEKFTNQNYSDIEIRNWLFPNKKDGKYLAGDSRGWKLISARENISKNNHKDFIKKIDYRPFDTRKIYYSPDMVDWGREKYMYNIIKGENLNLIAARQSTDENWNLIQVTGNMIDNRFHFSYKGIPSQFPLYMYPVENGQQNIEQSAERTPNLNTEIVKQIADKLGLTFTNEKVHTPNPSQEGNKNFAPIDILDYIYAVLHSPTYREKYKEFLKIDFPRVPYPKDKETFWQLVKLGGEIRQIHLLESPIVEKYITQYPIDGDNVVVNPRFLNSPPLEGCPQDGVVNSPPLEGCPQDGVVNSPDGCHQEDVAKTDQTVIINQTQIKFAPILELPYNPNLKQRAKELRQARNLPEVLFWMQVTKGGFHKIDFDRQRVIGNFIVDFYIKKLGLVIEIDGSSHDGKEEYDAEREEYLISLGLKVYRIQVDDVMKQMNNVLIGLENYIVENYGVLGNSVKPPRPADTPPKEGNRGKVYINDTQYFANVPEIAWNFYIGGYQPAQKWLKDRKGRKLEFEDILHYQKIIVALSETDRLMKEIDNIEIE